MRWIQYWLSSIKLPQQDLCQMQHCSSNKTSMPSIETPMLKLPIQEQLSSILPLKDLLLNQVRHKHWLWRCRTYLHLPPRYLRKDCYSDKRSPTPVRKSYSIFWHLGPWQQWRGFILHPKVQVNTHSMTTTTQYATYKYTSNRQLEWNYKLQKTEHEYFLIFDLLATATHQDKHHPHQLSTSELFTLTLKTCHLSIIV